MSVTANTLTNYLTCATVAVSFGTNPPAATANPSTAMPFAVMPKVGDTVSITITPLAGACAVFTPLVINIMWIDNILFSLTPVQFPCYIGSWYCVFTAGVAYSADFTTVTTFSFTINAFLPPNPLPTVPSNLYIGTLPGEASEGGFSLFVLPTVASVVKCVITTPKSATETLPASTSVTLAPGAVTYQVANDITSSITFTYNGVSSTLGPGTLKALANQPVVMLDAGLSVTVYNFYLPARVDLCILVAPAPWQAPQPLPSRVSLPAAATLAALAAIAIGFAIATGVTATRNSRRLKDSRT